MRTWAAYAGAVLVLVLATEARSGDPEDLIFANGFEPAPACDPDYGAHSTEATALFLGMIDDCSASALDVAGVLGTSQERDYSWFDGVDTFGCAVDPTLTLVATNALRACMFFDCMSGTTQVTCPMGSSPATSPSGLPGCCRGGSSFTLAVDISCDAKDDAARVFIRVDNAATGCTDYSVNVRF